MPESRVTGAVTRLMSDKGFGFIADTQGHEYFFHRTALREGWEDLTVGQTVSFVVRSAPKGPRAEDVRVEQGENG